MERVTRERGGEGLLFGVVARFGVGLRAELRADLGDDFLGVDFVGVFFGVEEREVRVMLFD
jgi:hypothetical protein